MHARNRFAAPYDFARLQRVVPALCEYLRTSPAGSTTIDFASPAAVRLLNKALLLDAYDLDFWDLPADALCPAVPGRLNYIHLLADLLGANELGRLAGGIRGLDIGTGASLVYPLLAVAEYGWHMTGSDIDATALRAAEAIVKLNPRLGKRITLRHQRQRNQLFKGVIRPDEQFDFTMCNPPFFASAKLAEAATREKWRKLRGDDSSLLNFGGQAHELWTPGGEPAFLQRMIRESVGFRQHVRWFTTLVSQRRHLREAKRQLRRVQAHEVRVLDYTVGNKQHQVLAWRFA